MLRKPIEQLGIAAVKARIKRLHVLPTLTDEQFAYVRRNHLGKCEVSFNAHYSDFDYLFNPRKEQTA